LWIFWKSSMKIPSAPFAGDGLQLNYARLASAAKLINSIFTSDSTAASSQHSSGGPQRRRRWWRRPLCGAAADRRSRASALQAHTHVVNAGALMIATNTVVVTASTEAMLL
jgi:hypothetical protein